MKISSYNIGCIQAISACFIWGALTFFFKMTEEASGLEILSHRILWTFLTLLFVIKIKKESLFIWDKKVLRVLLISSIIITANSFLFIYAMTTNKILEASLAYFISPLINIFLAFLFLKENLNKTQKISISLAFTALIIQIIYSGEIPILGLLLAITFSLYTFVKRKIKIDSIKGLLIETSFALPFVVLYLAYNSDTIYFYNAGFNFSSLLIIIGILTAISFLLFNASINRIPLRTLSFLLYLEPSLFFLIGIFIYKEELNYIKLLSFILIWIALFILSLKYIKKTN